MLENMEALFQPAGPTAVKLQTITVTIDPTVMVDDFAKAIVREAERKAPLVMQQQPLSEEDLVYLCRAILWYRVAMVNGMQVPWRQLKLVRIPDFIQMSISMVGEVIIKESGLKLIPDMDGEYDIRRVLTISENLAAYEDHIHMQRDAFPRDTKGNVDVMSTALINDYVRSLRQATHPADTYVAAFLGFQLKQEQMFQILYRVNYDDLEYVATSIRSVHRRLI